MLNNNNKYNLKMKKPGFEHRSVFFDIPVPCKISTQKYGIVNATGTTLSQWIQELDYQYLPFFWMVNSWKPPVCISAYAREMGSSFLRTMALEIYHNICFASVITFS